MKSSYSVVLPSTDVWVQFYWMSEKQEPERVSPIRYPSLPKTYSDKPARRDERLLQTSSQSKPMTQQVISYILMKQKFDKLYKNIERISLKEDQTIIRKEREAYSESPEPNIKAIHLSERRTDPQICKVRTSHLYPKLSLPDQSLQINTVSQLQYRRGQSVTTAGRQVQMMRKSNYRKKFHDNVGHKSKMSNNIKDYLSVQRISIRQMQESLLYHKSKLIKQNRLSNLLGFKQVNPENLEQQYHSVQIKPEKEEIKIKQVPSRRPAKFKPPFELYYYRDFMWQVAYSNSLIVQPVEEYEQKLKIYIGPGNNSNLVKGVMRRRPWWTLTSDPKEATFLWTQIKVMSCFGLQKKGERLPSLTEPETETPLLKSSSIVKSTILNPFQQKRWQNYWRTHIDKERKTKQTFRFRTALFKLTETPMAKVKQQLKIHNHFVNNFIIGNKKALFKTMNEYYSKLNQNVFDYLPLTFHVKNGLEDDEYLKFLQYFYVMSKASRNDPNCQHKFNAWIVKPGENTNRGNGIIVCLELNEIKNILKKQQKHSDGTLKTYIIQKYIEKPLLYKKRKFDLRHYMMVNCCNGRMKGYWYREGYVRTTSTEYTLKISNGSVHLTNDAVQKYLPDYGKYQKANKISYEELDQFMKKQDQKFDFNTMIYPRMKKIATDIIHASAMNIDPERKVNNFQVFGLDFMIDSSYQVYLIEVNSNPCLQTNCPILSKLIPDFIEDTLQICVDPVFPAPLGFKSKYPKYYQNLHQLNKYELVFDERIDGAQSIGESVIAGGAEDEEDVFDDDGQDFQEGV